jgi:Lon protease-like protein
MMPMFPLGSPLLPGSVLPLHVFEPRYRQLVRDCLDDPDHEFGVVLIERGFEVGGGDIRSNVGTVARMLQVAELGDGRFALMTIGTRRIKVNAWVPDDPYPLADVDDWPDDETSEGDLAERTAAIDHRVRRLNALASELGGSRADTSYDLSDDPLVASYHLCSLAPIGPADQQRLLCASGPSERLALLDAVLDDVEPALLFRLEHQSQVDDASSDFDEP